MKEYGDNRTTFCDYDSVKSPNVLGMWAIGRRLGLRPASIRYDRTKRGWHVIVLWNKGLHPLAIVALQAVLGSDLKREGLNLMRVMSNPRSKKWNLLYSRKLS